MRTCGLLQAAQEEMRAKILEWFGAGGIKVGDVDGIGGDLVPMPQDMMPMAMTGRAGEDFLTRRLFSATSVGLPVGFG